MHSGTSDSENFILPGRFRVTYTGTDPTCAFDIADAATGEDIEFVSDLGGGGFQRLFIDVTMAEVYLTDFIGCDDGIIQFGPDE